MPAHHRRATMPNKPLQHMKVCPKCWKNIAALNYCIYCNPKPKPEESEGNSAFRGVGVYIVSFMAIIVILPLIMLGFLHLAGIPLNYEPPKPAKRPAIKYTEEDAKAYLKQLDESQKAEAARSRAHSDFLVRQDRGSSAGGSYDLNNIKGVKDCVDSGACSVEFVGGEPVVVQRP
jgi:hypothetical protein